MTPKELYYKYGLRSEDAVRAGAPLWFRKKLRAIIVSENARLGYTMFGFGWKWWQERWTLERERECLNLYEKTRSVRQTAVKMQCYCVEVAYLASSVGRLLDEHSHKWRDKNICTLSLLEKVKPLLQHKTTPNLSKLFNIRLSWLKRGMHECGLQCRRWKHSSEEEQARVIALYKKGVVPKEMHKHGVTVNWMTIYWWIRRSGCGTMRYNVRGRLREQFAKAQFKEEAWEAYERLVRRLTEDTWKKHRHEIDPVGRTRSKTWHLDHKTSVFKAFLLKWPPEKTAHKRNLQMLPWYENIAKFTG